MPWQRSIAGCEDFLRDIGRAGSGQTYIRFVNMASGRFHKQVGLNGETQHAVVERLLTELMAEFQTNQIPLSAELLQVLSGVRDRKCS